MLQKIIFPVILMVIAVLIATCSSPPPATCPCGDQTGTQLQCPCPEVFTGITPQSTPNINIPVTPLPTNPDTGETPNTTNEVFSPVGTVTVPHVTFLDPELQKLKFITEEKINSGSTFGNQSMDPRITKKVLELKELGYPVDIIGLISESGEPTPLIALVQQIATQNQKNEIAKTLIQTAKNYNMRVQVNIGPREWYNATQGSLVIGVEKERYVGVLTDLLPTDVSPLVITQTDIQAMNFGEKVNDTICVAPEPFLQGTTSSGNPADICTTAQSFTKDYIIIIGREQGGFEGVFREMIEKFEAEKTIELYEFSVSEYEQTFGVHLALQGIISQARIFSDKDGYIHFSMGHLTSLQSLEINKPVGLIQQPINSGFLTNRPVSDPYSFIQHMLPIRGTKLY